MARYLDTTHDIQQSKIKRECFVPVWLHSCTSLCVPIHPFLFPSYGAASFYLQSTSHPHPCCCSYRGESINESIDLCVSVISNCIQVVLNLIFRQDSELASLS